MKKKIKQVCLLALLFFGLMKQGISQTENSESWIQFRGKNRSGISQEKLPQMNWTKSKPELVWKKNLGSGFSELVISGGKIYTMISEQIDSVSGSEFIAVLDEKTGKELWRSKVDSIYIDKDGWGNGPKSTPTIDDKYIYSFSSWGKLSANSLKDGKLIWQVDFDKEFGSTRPRWAFSSSPLLVDDLVVMEVGGTKSRAFIAFNKKTGKIVWKKGNGTPHYSSPLLVTIDNQKQIIFANGRTLGAYNFKGDTLWTFMMPITSPMAMPVLIEKNKIFVSSMRGGFVIAKIENNKATEIIKGGSMKNDYNSSCYYNGYIYGFHVAALRCISAETGEIKWTKRGYGKGSLILVDDKLLVLSDQGKLILVDASPDAYKDKGFIQPIKGKSWTAPSFANGKVFVRNLTEMACYKLK